MLDKIHFLIDCLTDLYFHSEGKGEISTDDPHAIKRAIFGFALEKMAESPKSINIGVFLSAIVSLYCDAMAEITGLPGNTIHRRIVRPPDFFIPNIDHSQPGGILRELFLMTTEVTDADTNPPAEEAQRRDARPEESSNYRRVDTGNRS